MSNQNPVKSSSFASYFVWKISPFTPIGRAINTARQRLYDAEIVTAPRDAHMFMASVLNQQSTARTIDHEKLLDEQQATRYTELITRLVNNEPLCNLHL